MKPKYIIVYHQYTVDEQDKWLVEVKKKARLGYSRLEDVGVGMIESFTGYAKDIVKSKGLDTQDQARKWAMDVIQNDSQEVQFIKKIEEGVWM